MSAITATNAGGAGGLTPVSIEQSLIDVPVEVRDTIPVRVTLASQTAVPQNVNISSQSNPIEIDDSTPIQVEGSLVVSSASPSISNTLTKGNMTAVGGGVYQIAQTLGDLGAFQNIGVKYFFNGVNQPDIRTIIVGSVGGRLAFLSNDTVSTAIPSGNNTVSHKFASLNTIQQASNFDNPAVAPFTDAGTYWQPTAGQIRDVVGSHIGFDENSQIITWINNSNGGNPDFTINFLATRI